MYKIISFQGSENASFWRTSVLYYITERSLSFCGFILQTFTRARVSVIILEVDISSCAARIECVFHSCLTACTSSRLISRASRRASRNLADQKNSWAEPVCCQEKPFSVFAILKHWSFRGARGAKLL